MTEQEITQARSDVDQLDIEQLRCGVMLQLLKIEELTKERDALALGVDQWRVDYNELRLERNALAADAARYRWLRSSRHNDATVMTYVDGLDDWVAWADGEDVDTSVDTAMSQAGVSVERDALAAAAKQALEFIEHVWRDVSLNDFSDDLRFKAEAALRQAGVQ